MSDKQVIKEVEQMTVAALSYSVAASVLLSGVSALESESVATKAIDELARRAEPEDKTPDYYRRVLRRTAEWVLEHVPESSTPREGGKA